MHISIDSPNRRSSILERLYGISQRGGILGGVSLTSGGTNGMYSDPVGLGVGCNCDNCGQESLHNRVIIKGGGSHALFLPGGLLDLLGGTHYLGMKAQDAGFEHLETLYHASGGSKITLTACVGCKLLRRNKYRDLHPLLARSAQVVKERLGIDPQIVIVEGGKPIEGVLSQPVAFMCGDPMCQGVEAVNNLRVVVGGGYLPVCLAGGGIFDLINMIPNNPKAQEWVLSLFRHFHLQRRRAFLFAHEGCKAATKYLGSNTPKDQFQALLRAREVVHDRLGVRPHVGFIERRGSIQDIHGVTTLSGLQYLASRVGVSR